MNHGISILQGPHHVAQKSSRMTLPLNADSFTSLLLRSLSVKFRFAGLAFAGQAEPAADDSPVAAAMRSNDGHGSAGSVSSASASAPTAAIVHRIFIVCSESPSPL